MEYNTFSLTKIYKKIFKLLKFKNLSAEEQEFLNYKLTVLSEPALFQDFLLNKKTNIHLKKKLNNYLKLKNLTINFKKNKISVNKFFFCKFFFKMNYELTYAILKIAFNFFTLKKEVYAIFYGDMYKNSNINLSNLNNFFLKKRELFKLDNEKIIFNYKNKKFKNSKYIFDKNSLLFIASKSLKKEDKLKLILKILYLLLSINIKILKNNYLILLSEEYLNIELIKMLKKKNIITNIFFFHTSAINSLPLWTFNNDFFEEKKYIFDSISNFYPLKFKKNLKLDETYIPQLKYLNFKHIFSSDRNFDKIKKKKIQKIKIIQPFSYNIKRKREKIRTKNNICIFDYNPSKKPYLLDNKDYEYIQFGSEKSQLKFIKSILKVVNKINKNRKNIVHCYIKRQITPGRNLLHLKSIHTLKKEYKNFHILNPQISIEDNFQFFQTVISYPNTSPSIYYSKITGKDSFYYDVENLLQNKYDKNITLIKSENLLEKRLNKIFKSYD